MEFNWIDFTEENLEQLNKEGHPDMYGYIHVKDGVDRYLVDVECETKKMYGRDGISLNIYVTDENLHHLEPVYEAKDIITATNYKRFKTRAKKSIKREIMLYKGAGE